MRVSQAEAQGRRCCLIPPGGQWECSQNRYRGGVYGSIVGGRKAELLEAVAGEFSAQIITRKDCNSLTLTGRLVQTGEDDAAARTCGRAVEGRPKHVRHADHLQRDRHDQYHATALRVQGAPPASRATALTRAHICEARTQCETHPVCSRRQVGGQEQPS